MRALPILLALLFATAAAADSQNGIVYGYDHAFVLTAPDGWVLDDASGAPQGLAVVSYERGRTWTTAAAACYATTTSKAEGTRTVDELIAYDVEQFRAKAPRLRVSAAPDLHTRSGVARVRLFEGDRYGNYEAVAYVDGPKAIVMIVLSARTKAAFDGAWPAFEQLVRSYQFLTSDLRIER